MSAWRRAILPVLHQRAAARHQEVWRDLVRRASASGARDRCSNGWHADGLRGEFNLLGHKMAGQNNRAFPVVTQYVGGDVKIAWPRALQTADPVLPLPTSPYASRQRQPGAGHRVGPGRISIPPIGDSETWRIPSSALRR